MNQEAATKTAEVSSSGLQMAQETGLVPALANPIEVTNKVRTVLKNHLKAGIKNDYAEIPGTKGMSLLKPGAEKLLRFFQLYARLTEAKDVVNKDDNYTEVVYSCEIVGSRPSPDGKQWQEIVVCKLDGSANSEERAFRSQKLNQGMMGLRPSIRSRAMKRAMVGAVRIALNASDIFSQSEEDLLAAEEATMNPYDPARDEALARVKEIFKAASKDEFKEKCVKAIGQEAVDSLAGTKTPWARISTNDLMAIVREFDGEPDPPPTQSEPVPTESETEPPDPNQNNMFEESEATPAQETKPGKEFFCSKCGEKVEESLAVLFKDKPVVCPGCSGEAIK